jgi:hypothetical protein
MERKEIKAKIRYLNGELSDCAPWEATINRVIEISPFGKTLDKYLDRAPTSHLLSLSGIADHLMDKESGKDFKHPEMGDDEVFLVNVPEDDESYKNNIPIQFESVRMGKVAYAQNGQVVVEGMVPLFARYSMAFKLIQSLFGQFDEDNDDI